MTRTQQSSDGHRAPSVSQGVLGWSLACTMAWASLLGCDVDNPGTPVPDARLNFPIALTLGGVRAPGEPAPYLLVANSNFDLRYASGSLQSYSLEAIEAALASAVTAGTCAPEDGTICRVADSELPALMRDEVLLGSHMDGLVLGSRGDRAYLPVRSGRGGLTWVDFDPASGALRCGVQDAGGRQVCDALHREADGAEASRLGLTLPSDPVALAVVPASRLAAGRQGDALVMAHRNGNASLFLDEHAAGSDEGPRFVHTVGGVPNDVVTAEADPTGLVWLTSAAQVASRQTRDLVALEVVLGGPEDTFVAQLGIARRMALRGVDDGFDTRDLAFDETGGTLWVLARRPEAIVTVDLTRVPAVLGDAPLGPVWPVGFGPSRVERFALPVDPDGAGPRAAEAHTFLLASCFDARSLFVVDPALGVVATVAGLDGPFEMVVDEARQHAYVVDFRLSYVWVIDLAPLAAGGAPVTLGRIGSGRAPSVFVR